jgi:hypothetical protein
MRVLLDVNKITGDLVDMTARVAVHVRTMNERQVYGRPYGEPVRKSITELMHAFNELEKNF